MEKKIDPEALEQMRSRGGAWAVYENMAMDSGNVGHLQFLRVGAGCTYGSPPTSYPADNQHGMGWRYKCVGMVDLKTGDILDLSKPVQLKGAFGELMNFSMNDGEDTALATVSIFGVAHHVTFVKVTEDETGVQVGTNDPHDRLDDVLSSQEGAAQTVSLPGLDGEWVVGIDPYRR